MNTIFLNNKSLELSINKTYFVIDAIYLDEVKRELPTINNMIIDIREKIFPHTDTPYALSKTKRTIFTIDQIKKTEDSDVITDKFSCFSSDTGLIIFICEDIFIEFLKNYSYEKLVDSENELINTDYWNKLTSQFSITDTGLILSYMDSGHEFDGSGAYRIDKM